MGAGPEKKSVAIRNMISFWIFGMCNNFAYSVMLGAAQDILKRNSESATPNANNTEHCVEHISFRDCAPASAGVVLICNILPCLIVKLLCPFFMHHIPYGVRHFIICMSQTASLMVTAWANSVPTALLGVLLASFSCGFGETTYLGLASHYSKNSISTWSSGSGMAGFAGTFSYAVLTDDNLLALTPRNAMLVMLIVPISFTFSYYFILVRAPTIPAISATKPSTWLDFSTPYDRDLTRADSESTATDRTAKDGVSVEAQNRPLTEQLLVVKSLLKYMIPFGTVYFMQYFVKQGLIELVVFDCAHGFHTTPSSQYRWYQVFYHIGVFLSRSSINIIHLNFICISLLAVVQTLTTVVIFITAIYAFIPYFGIVCGIMFFIGVVGGTNYANTFYHIHRKVDPTIREFALSTVTFADTIGILAAAVAAIPVHNWICAMKWYG
nr:Batten's disease protein Cln3 domain containing protein [Haemonchus contortus]